MADGDQPAPNSGNQPAPSAGGGGSQGYSYTGPVAKQDRGETDRELANKAFGEGFSEPDTASSYKPLKVNPDELDGFIAQWEQIKSATEMDRWRIREAEQATPLASDAEASGMYNTALHDSLDQLEKRHKATLDYIERHIQHLKESNQAYRNVEQANTDDVNRAGGNL
jgi:hypothetical protein